MTLVEAVQLYQATCWILIARHHLNIIKNIPHRPEVQRICAPKSPKCVLAQACLYEVCYQTKILRNAAEIVGRFCAKLKCISLRLLCANVYTRYRFHGNIIGMKLFKWYVIARVNLYVHFLEKTTTV